MVIMANIENAYKEMFSKIFDLIYIKEKLSGLWML